jgi:phosphoglycolate/pyridoxal phosphate phosphatase family enzyme
MGSRGLVGRLTPRHDTNNIESHTFRMNFKNYIFDCDGVLWKGSTLIPGVIETLKVLKSKNKKLLFVSNNSTSSREEYLQKFKKFGIDFIEKSDIINSGYIAALYASKLKKKVFVIGMDGLIQELKEENIEILENSFLIKEFKDMKLLSTENQVGAVVVGFDLNINYTKLALAHALLKDKDVEFIATNTDSTFPMENGTLPGTGSIVSSIVTSTNRQPIVLGKPNLEMLNILLQKFNLNPLETCMIGDRLDTDILFGKNGNLHTILVLSGVSTLEDVENSLIKPDLVIESIADLRTTAPEAFRN